jgi:hypothetical protein
LNNNCFTARINFTREGEGRRGRGREKGEGEGEGRRGRGREKGKGKGKGGSKKTRGRVIAFPSSDVSRRRGFYPITVNLSLDG